MPANSEKPRHPTEPVRPRRPILLTLLLWVLILWTVLGWLRFFGAITNRGLIIELLPGWTYAYLLGAGLIWGLAGIPAIMGLVWGASWTRTWIAVTALLYPLVYWVERLFIWQSRLGQRNWPFMLLLTGLWLGLVIWILQSGRVRRFLTRKKDKN